MHSTRRQVPRRSAAGASVALRGTALVGALLAVAITTGACSDSSPATPSSRGSEPLSGQGGVPGLPQSSEPVELDPADFTTTIDNPYWPMSPGSTWTYTETDTSGAEQKVVVEVTEETKMIANGIEARVIRDTVTERGVPVEVTEDWYAQDKDGNIWYLGEYVSNYKDGAVVNHEGSFEAGVDGAQPGIALPANPAPGMAYRQEYYQGHAEDRAAVVTVGEEQVEVPFGHFPDQILMTRDLVPLEPTVQELKFYAPGVGPLLSIHLDGAGGRAELVDYTPGS